ncbi:MAG: T9SS type A sorting domain-containing protein [Calditrichia bacterium]|nr:T9SS type A sorting domain-containing protein [Calditrichia bacterium]
MGLQFTGLAATAAEDIGDIQLQQSYPNPVNKSLANSSSTVIEYQLRKPQHVRLELYDVLGRKVLTLDEGYRTADIHRVQVNMARLATGKYFYRLESGQNVQIRQLTIIK